MTVQDIFSGVRSSLAIKAPCKALSTTNLVLSGEQTINGVACVDGDRVIPNGQTDAREGGIWIVSTGLWSRAPDADGNNDFAKGTMVRVNFGTNAGIYALTNSDPVVIGTTELSFQLTLDSSSIEFIQAGAGAVARSIQSKAREVVSFADFATPQQALDSGAQVVLIPDNYTVTVPSAGLTVPDGVSIEGHGINSVVDATAISDGETGISLIGSVAGSTTLTGDVAKNANILPLASVSGVTPGTWLLVRSTLDNSWSGWRTYRKQGFFQVQSVASLNVTITEQTSTTFESASTVVEILNPVTSYFRDFKLLTKASGDCSGLGITYGLNCLVENVHQIGGKAVGLGCNNSINTTFRKCSSFLDASAVDTQYAFAVTSCDKTLIVDCDGYGTRHAIAIVGDYQCRRTHILNCRLTGGRIDVHGSADGTTYENCKIGGGITLGGRDTRYLNCEVTAPQNTGTNSDSIVCLVNEMMGGEQAIIGGTYTCLSNSIAVGWSPIDLGRGNAMVNTNVREDITYKFRDFYFNYPNLSGNCIRSQNTSAFKANFDIQGVTFNMPSAANVVRYEGTAGGADASFVVVDGITSNATVVPLPLFKQGSAATGYATTKMRLQPCTKQVVTSIATGSTSAVQTFAFPFEYHRAPDISFSYQGARNPSGVAGKEIYHRISSVNVLQAQVTYETIGGGTFGANFDATGHYRAGISEL